MILSNNEIGQLCRDLEVRFAADNLKLSVTLAWEQGHENLYENRKIVPVVSFGYKSFLCPEGVFPQQKTFEEIYDKLFSIIHFFIVGFKEAVFSPILDFIQIHGIFFDATEQEIKKVSKDSTFWISCDGNSIYLLNPEDNRKILYQLFDKSIETTHDKPPIIGKTVAIISEFGLQEETVMKEMHLFNKVDFRRNFKEEKENGNEGNISN